MHELAHELLHHTDRLSHVTAETEAESIAFVVCAYLGIPGLNSPNYIALVGADKEKIRLSLERIQRTARQLIEAIDPAPVPDKD